MDRRGRALRRIPLKEEYVALCGEHTGALILAQMEHLYRTSRYVDDYIAEEVRRARALGKSVELEPSHGWVRMDADKLAREVMLKLTPTTMRRRLRSLLDSGWVLERDDPRHKWDRTKQYRYDPIQVARDLWQIGYVLAGWHWPEEVRQLLYGSREIPESKQPAQAQVASCKMQNRSVNMTDRGSKTQDREDKNAVSYIDSQSLNSEMPLQINQSKSASADPKAHVTQGPDERSRDKTEWKVISDDVMAITSSEISDDAYDLAEIIQSRVPLAGADAARLAEYALRHDQRDLVAAKAKQCDGQHIQYPWAYLMACIKNAQGAGGQEIERRKHEREEARKREVDARRREIMRSPDQDRKDREGHAQRKREANKRHRAKEVASLLRRSDDSGQRMRRVAKRVAEGRISFETLVAAVAEELAGSHLEGEIYQEAVQAALTGLKRDQRQCQSVANTGRHDEGRV